MAGAAVQSPGNPDKEFSALKKEYEADDKKLRELIEPLLKQRDATKDKEEEHQLNLKAEALLSERARKYAARFLAFAEAHPQAPAAFEALVLALRAGGQYAVDSGVRWKVIDRLTDYAASPKIKEILRQATGIPHESADRLAREVIKKNPDRTIQALACQGTADGLWLVARAAEKARTDAGRRADLERRVGKKYAEQALAGVAKARKDAAAWDAIVWKNYADVVFDSSVGKPAPELIGSDLAGKEVRLSTLKGKVVVLEVWASSERTCRGVIPLQRELVERHKGSPFVFVGISADKKKETLLEFLAREPLPWTHWWNGSEGGILSAWKISVLPTVIVLDAKGVIRYRAAGNEGIAGMHRAVDRLLKELKDR